eukprot:247577-Alexandrium_andersonii.AAC.1
MLHEARSRPELDVADRAHRAALRDRFALLTPGPVLRPGMGKESLVGPESRPALVARPSAGSSGVLHAFNATIAPAALGVL